jgi:hypothetical protein
MPDMAAREIHPVQFATRVIGPSGAEMTTYTNDNPYRAGADADPKVSPAPESVESSQPEAREITPVQGMNNAPVSDLPPIVKVRAGTDPNATYGQDLPKGVEVEGPPETALEKRATDPADDAVVPIPIEKVETALSVEEQTAAALAATEQGEDPAQAISAEEAAKRRRQANLEKARAAKAQKASRSESPDKTASAAKEAEDQGLIF